MAGYDDFTLDLQWGRSHEGSLNLMASEETTLGMVRAAIVERYPCPGLKGILVFWNHRVLVGRRRTMREFGITGTTCLVYYRIY